MEGVGVIVRMRIRWGGRMGNKWRNGDGMEGVGMTVWNEILYGGGMKKKRKRLGPVECWYETFMLGGKRGSGWGWVWVRGTSSEPAWR